MMANRVMETRMMAPPTPINTPSTGEMINRVFNDPIFAWYQYGWADGFDSDRSQKL